MLRANHRLTFTAAMLTITWLCAVPATNAHAQSQPPALPGQTQPGQTQNIPDQKLDAAAAAIKKLATVREDYEQRIQAAEPNDKERLTEEAKGALAKAITDQGLSLPEYTQILVIARNDPEVQEKIIQRLGTSDK
jgi:hypothetical protein